MCGVWLVLVGFGVVGDGAAHALGEGAAREREKRERERRGTIERGVGCPLRPHRRKAVLNTTGSIITLKQTHRSIQ